MHCSLLPQYLLVVYYTSKAGKSYPQGGKLMVFPLSESPGSKLIILLCPCTLFCNTRRKIYKKNTTYGRLNPLRHCIQGQCKMQKFYCNLTFYKLNTYLILTYTYVLAGANRDDQTRIFLKETFLSGSSEHMMSTHAQKTLVCLTSILVARE